MIPSFYTLVKPPVCGKEWDTNVVCPVVFLAAVAPITFWEKRAKVFR